MRKSSFSSILTKAITLLARRDKSHYRYASNKCWGNCGSYKQIIWAQSYALGCSITACKKLKTLYSSGPKNFIVCLYGPASTTGKPYISGPSASACPTGYKPKKKLCSNSSIQYTTTVQPLTLSEPTTAGKYEPVTATLSDVDIKTAVDLHNEFRRSVKPTASNMIEVAWDPALARVAREFTQKCEYNGFLVLKPLNDYSITGMNSLANEKNLTYSSLLTIAITHWAAEQPYYIYRNSTCRLRNCESYEQVVMAEMRGIGCSITACKMLKSPSFFAGPENLIACYYGPVDLMRKPYISGPSASSCPVGYEPKNKLCSKSNNTYPTTVSPPTTPEPTSTTEPESNKAAILSASDIQAVLDKHNELRRSVEPTASNMMEMIWDPALAKSADNYTQKCVLDDSDVYISSSIGYSSVGRNTAIFGMRKSSFSSILTKAITLLARRDKSHYRYASNKCWGNCGSYKQIIWAQSYALGCSITACKKLKTLYSSEPKNFIVCLYGPASTTGKPYISGPSASACPTGYKPKNKLCSNSSIQYTTTVQPLTLSEPTTASKPESVTAVLSDADIKTAVDQFNEIRRSVDPTASNMLEMVWDPVLAESAYNFSRSCIFDGDVSDSTTYSSVGYTVVMSKWQLNFTGQLSEAITGWANERHRYTYGSNHCPRYCGNYKQIIWAETYAVGCSITACKEVFGPYNSGPRNLIVCNYGPGSSWSTPYISGPSASACPTGYRPKNKLCSNFNIQYTTAVQPLTLSEPTTASKPESVTAVLSDADIKTAVDQLNEIRRSVKPTASNMLELVWDPVLAEIAKNYTSKCVFDYNEVYMSDYSIGYTSVGMVFNMAEWKLNFTGQLTEAITNWKKEGRRYTYRNSFCLGNCEKYTQIIWAQTYAVGCSITACNPVKGPYSLGPKNFVVCNYGPASGSGKPYISGPSASACPTGYIPKNKLCSNSSIQYTTTVQPLTLSEPTTASKPESVTAVLSDADIKTAVDQFNEIRRSVKPTASNMLEMVWDPVLAESAYNFSRSCIFDGDVSDSTTYSSVGYTVVMSKWQLNFTGQLTEAITGWANERHIYTYRNDHCPRYCGNYKQIIWAETYAVGCSITACKEVFGPYNSGPRNLIVCNYGPGSSWSTPYISGPSASACPTGYRPKNKLCSNFNIQYTTAVQPLPLSKPTTASKPESVTAVLSDADIKTAVDQFNEFRRSVDPTASNMLEMVWDPVLAEIAGNYTKKCEYDDSDAYINSSKKYPSVVRTIATSGSRSSFSSLLSRAIAGWTRQKNSYKYNTDSCWGNCESYKQIITAQSYAVGCSITACERVKGPVLPLPRNLIVCFYGPASTTGKPYISGPSASACPTRYRPKNKLCSKSSIQYTTAVQPVLTTGAEQRSNFSAILKLPCFSKLSNTTNVLSTFTSALLEQIGKIQKGVSSTASHLYGFFAFFWQ
uniref:uncharacterized protein LOC113474179 n=1 Tax=Ciona intestinalis TaxID=7719 RepID=UPI000EF52427|nr:uncharacterized protein LOC113474179 [Ciona intestinalis]|eukprot:XP_026689905.1 uncharacterized protein LOC113474179 [Ciona intestinalis]